MVKSYNVAKTQIFKETQNEKDEELFGPDGCSGETRSYNFSTNQYDYYDRDKHTLKKL